MFFILRPADYVTTPYTQDDILKIQTEDEFNKFALLAFRFQYNHNPFYRRFCDAIQVKEVNVSDYHQIPFLPIEFFKSQVILSGVTTFNATFRSSGTTGEQRSEHRVYDLEWYNASILSGFVRKFGAPESYSFLGLLPGYLDRPDSSLIYMVHHLMNRSRQKINRFYSSVNTSFREDVAFNREHHIPTIIFGVTHSLINVSKPDIDIGEFIIIETGGMKGRAKEIIRNELHQLIMEQWGVSRVFSEYGMTELLSQAYATNADGFDPPPWMKFIIREIHDPFTQVHDQRVGSINVIDLANIYSCCFIATGDLGKKTSPNRIDVLGRLDYSDVRGCNLLFN